MKAGVKTSEFWLAIVGAILPVLNDQFGWKIPSEQVIAVAGLIGTYILGRSGIKLRNGR